MRSNLKEGVVIIIIDAVFNSSLLSPLYYLGIPSSINNLLQKQAHVCLFFTVFKMQERHDILSRTIGYFDEEQEAMDTGNMLLICSTITMIVGSLLQIIFFYLYNGPFHPFANILVDETEGKSQFCSI